MATHDELRERRAVLEKALELAAAEQYDFAELQQEQCKKLDRRGRSRATSQGRAAVSTEQRLKEIRWRLAAATKGPWNVFRSGKDEGFCTVASVNRLRSGGILAREAKHEDDVHEGADQHLIANAPSWQLPTQHSC